MSNGFKIRPVLLLVPVRVNIPLFLLLGRMLYNYKGKYFLNASLRNDASSQIPSKNRNQKFWAVGAAWELTKEDFMKGQDFFDFLKLKDRLVFWEIKRLLLLSNGTPNNYPFYPNLNTGMRQFLVPIFIMLRTNIIALILI